MQQPERYFGVIFGRRTMFKGDGLMRVLSGDQRAFN
jgi:hypothetical protein